MRHFLYMKRYLAAVLYSSSSIRRKAKEEDSNGRLEKEKEKVILTLHLGEIRFKTSKMKRTIREFVSRVKLFCFTHFPDE